jgi:hypothetical protein
MRKPNYSMERKDRERAKQAKAAAKLEKRAAARAGDQQPDPDATADGGAPPRADEGTKPGG